MLAVSCAWYSCLSGLDHRPVLKIAHASVYVPGEHKVNAHILVDTSVELPDRLERGAVEYCETSMDQPFRNETVSDYDHSSCRFSVCKLKSEALQLENELGMMSILHSRFQRAP